MTTWEKIKSSPGKLWAKVNSLPWAVWIGTVVAGLMFALTAAGVAKRNAQSKDLERRAEKNAAAGAQRHLDRAVKQTEKAESIKQQTELKKTLAEARLDKIGESDEDLETLVDRWNAGRLRKSG